MSDYNLKKMSLVNNYGVAALIKIKYFHVAYQYL